MRGCNAVWATKYVVVAARILANGACDKKPVIWQHGKMESQSPTWKEDPRRCAVNCSPLGGKKTWESKTSIQ